MVGLPNLPSVTTAVTPVVHTKDGRVYANSRDVAAYFGKRHFHVLRDIDNLGCSPEFAQSNFGCSPYIDPTGRSLRSVGMTRDGFTFLVMGFNGKDAARFKEAYIAAFNAMEERLRSMEALSSSNISNPADAARMWADAYRARQLEERGIVKGLLSQRRKLSS